ncbi:MAG: hypothetical protein LBU90_01270 [Bacteroidales bacterium]|jgi:flagellar basal body-associated protein FliL|nr:hypothetical protein [Bacteroidales bacterium]
MARLLLILIVLCAAWVIYQVWVVEKDTRTKEEKLLWTLLALLFSVITAGIFFFLEKEKNTNTTNEKPNDHEKITWN